MKPTHLLPPLLAAGIVFLWLSHQRATLSSLEKNLTQTPAPRPSPTRQPPLGWPRIATLAGERLPTLFDKQLLLRAKARIRSLSETELLAALDEVTTLDLDIRDRDDLRKLILASLQEKNLRAALDYLNHPDRRKEQHLSDPTVDILALWAATDPAAATAWLDEKIATGHFTTTALDGSNLRRSRIEAALLSVLFQSNPENAAKRVLTLPENQRGDTLQQLLFLADKNDHTFTGGTLSSFTTLIRSTLPPNEQTHLIASLGSNLVQHQSYQATDTFFEQAAITPHERESTINQAARGKFQQLAREDQLTAATVDEFRTWAATHTPDKVDQITGHNLTSTSYNGDSAFRRAADLALHYQQQGREKILTIFLLNSSHGGNSKSQLLELAEKITDPASREKVITQINGNPYLRP